MKNVNKVYTYIHTHLKAECVKVTNWRFNLWILLKNMFNFFLLMLLFQLMKQSYTYKIIYVHAFSTCTYLKNSFSSHIH